MGTVVWVCPFSSQAPELAKPRLQESMGPRQPRAGPCRSQPTDVEEKRNSLAVLGTCCISSCMGFGDTMAIQSWRRHKQRKVLEVMPDVSADATGTQGAGFTNQPKPF